MPQRTNHYQKLMLYVNQALASTSASITESAMLWDKESKQDREVDILIEDSTGPYPVRVAVECTERKRKLGAKDVEQLHTKHKNLGIGNSVIVTNKGFYKPAKAYALANNIQLLTFDAAMKLKWPEWFKKFKDMSLIHTSFTCTGAEVTFAAPHNEKFDPASGVTVKSTKYGNRNFHEYVYLRFQAEEPDILAQRVNGEHHWKYETPLEAIDGNGLVSKITDIMFTYVSDGVNIPVQYGELNGSSFGYGISTEVAPYKRMAVIASPSNELTPDGSPKLNVTIHVDTE